jgi:hypothetical protein
MKRFLLRISLFLLLFGLISEAVCRFVIAVPDRILSIRDDEFHFDRYAPETYGRSFRFGAGKLGQISNQIKINNRGWHSGQDYKVRSERDPSRTVIAIIGDSYIENRYCHFSTHLAAQLSVLIGDGCDVYAFGRDGANLLQLVNMTKYVSKNFDPDLIVYFARDGSISRSVRELTPINQVTQFQFSGEEPAIRAADLPQTREHERWLMQNIASLRYLRTNFSLSIRNPLRLSEKQEKSNSMSDEGHSQWISAASDSVVRELQKLNHERTFMFVFDANRLFIYGQSTESRQEESTILSNSCKDFDVPFLNFTDCFQAEYAVSGEKFEFPSNYHWNEHGNATAGQGLHAYLQDQHLLEGSGLKQ